MRSFHKFFWSFAFALLWFVPLGYRDLIRSDEGRYAEIAREMWLNGDWITPRLNGLKYFEKPPLQYWATTLFYHLFEPAPWTARLWPALTGFAGIMLCIWFGRRVLGRPALGYLAALIQMSTLWYMSIGHFNVLDMGLTFFLQVMLFGYAWNLYSAKDANKAAWMIGAGMAGAFLSKGLIAVVLPGLVFVVDSLWHRDYRPWKGAFQIRIWGIALVLAAPWCVAISLKNPEFPYFFFIHEHFERFTASSHRRDGPVYYFIPYLLIGLMPWTIIWLQSLADWLHNFRYTYKDVACSSLYFPIPEKVQENVQSANPDSCLDKKKDIRLQRLFIVWSVCIFAFFSSSHSKLPSYILPVFPALSWVLAFSLTLSPLQRWRNSIIGSIGFWILATLAILFVSHFIKDEWTKTLYSHYRTYLGISGLLMIAGSLVFLLNLTKYSKVQVSEFTYLKWLLLPVLLWSLAIQVALQGHQVFSPRQSIYPLVKEIEKEKGPFKKEWPFYSVDTYEQTLDFYIHRTTTLVHFFDEMEFGCKQEPAQCISSLEEWRIKWLKEHSNAYAILPTALYEQLYKSLPMYILGKNKRYVIVRRYP